MQPSEAAQPRASNGVNVVRASAAAARVAEASPSGRCPLVVRWPNGADLAPDAMYDAIRAAGRWIVP